MVEAEVTPDDQVDGLIRRLLGSPSVEHMHIHFARRSCFACDVIRAG
jgi:hypothetical protein